MHVLLILKVIVTNSNHIPHQGYTGPPPHPPMFANSHFQAPHVICCCCFNQQQCNQTYSQIKIRFMSHSNSDYHYPVCVQVDFLKRSELRQYEQERDQKLAADVRNRGRL